VDSVKVTYLMADGSFRSTLHGGTGGNPNLNVSLACNFHFILGCPKNVLTPLFTANQKLIAVYGRRLNTSGQYGQRKYVYWIIDISLV
jgi:hypothetical protein